MLPQLFLVTHKLNAAMIKERAMKIIMILAMASIPEIAFATFDAPLSRLSTNINVYALYIAPVSTVIASYILINEWDSIIYNRAAYLVLILSLLVIGSAILDICCSEVSRQRRGVNRDNGLRQLSTVLLTVFVDRRLIPH